MQDTVTRQITEPEMLHIGGTIGGLIAVIAFVAIVIMLILRANKSLKKEYALSGKK